jgi:type IV secretion system protein VirB8
MAGQVDKKDFEKYLAEARSWETDKVRTLETSRRTAWIVASVSTVLAVFCVVTMSSMIPIHKVDAYVVRVDSASGKVNVLKPLDSGDIKPEEAVNKYFVQWYVRWREGYIRPLADLSYYNVGIMSSPIEQTNYYKQLDTGNPNSPLNLYKNGGGSKIIIKSTVFVSPDSAQVYFDKEEDFAGDGKEKKVTQWMAVVRYIYSGAPMTDRDREVNPLGFTVLNYNVTNMTPPEKKAALGQALESTSPASVNQVTVIPTTSQLSVPSAASAPNVIVPEIKSIAVPNSYQGSSPVGNSSSVTQTQATPATK